jgi:signal transduction histidine kinase
MSIGSLRLRLLVSAAIAISLALFLAGLALTALFEQQVRNRVVQELNNDLLQLVGAIEIGANGDLKVIRALADPRYKTPYSGKYWRIDQVNGASPAELLRSRSLWDTDTKNTAANLGPEGEPLVFVERTITIKGKDGDVSLHLFVGTHSVEIEAPIKQFRDQLILYLSLIGAALTVAAWLQVTIGLRPLQALQKQISLLRTHNLKRLEGEFPTEVEPLVSELNDVLDIRDKSLERARQRAGDLAHGLMTPLTILSAIARDLEKRRLSRLGAEIEEQAENMRRHVERGLVRARLSTGRGHDLTPLAATVDAVFSTLKRLPKGDAIKWLNLVPKKVTVPVERNDLLELLGNLMDNARKYARSMIQVSYVENCIMIEDDGAGVPDEEIAAIRQRGRRLDEAKKGFGLGLAIVEDIADLYELKLSYGRSELGGLQVKLGLSP